ncbi:MAG: threonine synthase [Candidatus Bathyarchaeota archaeon B24]|nr:MAG: threonine synthase [Candidatus Bathyarchaeota archaeon B24]
MRVYCIECGKEYGLMDRVYTCRSCGGLLDIEYDYEAVKEVVPSVWLKRSMGVWRYLELLPVLNPSLRVSMGEGGTRLVHCRRLGKMLNLRHLYVKDEGGNPTGSFKDRGMTIGVTKALELGVRNLICASTGNTSSSLAAYSARAGLNCIVLIPSGKIALGKLAQALIYGAKVLAVKGGFDEALRIVRELSAKPDFYLLNSLNPYRLEGQKTGSFEIYEQLGGRPPDWLIIPVGNAGNISAYWKGFKELTLLGLTDLRPKMVGVQARGANPLVKAFRKHKDLTPLDQVETVATAIRIGNPVNWRKAIRAVEESGGLLDDVDDEDIIKAQRLLAKTEGLFVEPAGAVPIAYLMKHREDGLIDVDDVVVCVATGNGLKDPDIAIRFSEKPKEVEPNTECVLEELRRIGVV